MEVNYAVNIYNILSLWAYTWSLLHLLKYKSYNEIVSFVCLFPFLVPSCSYSGRGQHPLQIYQSNLFFSQMKEGSSLPMVTFLLSEKDWTRTRCSDTLSGAFLIPAWRTHTLPFVVSPIPLSYPIHSPIRGLHLAVLCQSQLGQKGCERKELVCLEPPIRYHCGTRNHKMHFPLQVWK